MKIRKLLLCAAAIGAMSSVTLLNAQEQKKGRGQMATPEQRIERLEQAVGALTDAQKTKIKEIYASSAKKMEGLSQEERREKMGEIMRESGKQIRDLLTADQQKKYDEMMAARGGGGGGGERKKRN